MDFKLRARQAESVESVTAELTDDVSGSRADPETASREVFGRMVRKEFDLPAELSDAAAEAAVREAIDTLHDGRIAAASTLLEDAFTTPCAEIHPTGYNAGADHQIACLRYDDRFDETTETFDVAGSAAVGNGAGADSGAGADGDRGHADD
jgi:peptide/nickel transport system ATP-binding protein